MRKNFLFLLLLFSLNIPLAKANALSTCTTFINENYPLIGIGAIFTALFAIPFYFVITEKTKNKYDDLSDKKFLKVASAFIESLYNKSQPARDLLMKFDLYAKKNGKTMMLATLEEINVLDLQLPVDKWIRKCIQLQESINKRISHNIIPQTIAALYTLKTQVENILNDLLKFKDLCPQEEKHCDNNYYSSSTDNWENSNSFTDHCKDHWHHQLHSQMHNHEPILPEQPLAHQETPAITMSDLHDVLLSSHVN